MSAENKKHIEIIQTPKKKHISKRYVSLWLAAILICCAFSFGILAGGAAPSLLANSFDLSVAKTKAKIKSTPATTTGKVLNTNAKVPDYLNKDVDFNLFWDVWNLVKNKSYDKNVPDTQLFYGALAGIVAAVGDPYTVFMTPQDSNQFQQDLKGNFEGIGAEIALKNGNIIIVAPLNDTPAEKAGLKPKDIILKINGTSTKDMSVDTAVKLIRGRKGTKVTLNIFREDFSEPKDFEIVRDAITVKSLTWEVKNNNLAYIKIRQFNEDTMTLFDKAINEILAKGTIKGIILDLRNDPGGYLETAIAVAGEWDGSATVVSEKMRDGTEIKHVADKQARLTAYPTAVLVDGGSASASEIVAGALQDWGKAQIVGDKTFGKGSVQDLTDLPDGSSLKITIAKWFTPKGRSIDEQGITPDIYVQITPDDYNKDRDPQLDKALEILKTP